MRGRGRSSTVPTTQAQFQVPQSEKIVVDLAIDAEELKRLYRGVSRTVLARARDGRWVRFPAQVLRAHVMTHGVHGAFALHVTDGRLTTLQRLV